MTRNPVDTHFLVFQQDVVAYLQHCHGSIKACPHEVGKCEVVVGTADDYRTALGKTRDGLTGDVVIGYETTAVGVAFQGNIEQTGEQLVGVEVLAVDACEVAEELCPCIYVAGTVVTVYHCYRTAVRSRDDIDALIRL